jgi:hypothetical protein
MIKIGTVPICKPHAVALEAAVELAQLGKLGVGLAGVGRQELVQARVEQRLRQAQAQELAAPVAAEVPGHHLHPAERVGRRPRLGVDARHPELDRQHRLRGEKRVHACGVGFEQPPRFGVEVLEVCFGGAPDADRAQEPVGFERALAEGLREAPRCGAPVDLHLPEPVLRVDVAQRVNRIGEALRRDVRHAVAIAQDLDRLGKPREADLAFFLGQGLAQVEIAAGRREDDEHECRKGRPEQGLHRLSIRFPCDFGECGGAANLL